MVQPPYQQPDDEYRRWLEALAKAMGSAKPISQPTNDPNPPKASDLWGLESAGRQPPDSDFPQTPTEATASEHDFQPDEAEKVVSLAAPRVWDLCKPYVLFVAVVLLGGLASIGGLVWLTQWLIPPTRSPSPSAPIDARWDVRRRGLHILPEDQTASQVSKPSAKQADSEQTTPEQSVPDEPVSETPLSEKP